MSKRIIICGLSEYRNLQILPDIDKDIDILSKTFIAKQYSVEFLKDALTSNFVSKIRQYGAGENRYSCTLFYFIGHGVCYQNNDLLLPLDADLSQIGKDYRFFADVRFILEQLNDNSGFTFVILDACREEIRGNYFKNELNLQFGALAQRNLKLDDNQAVLYSTSHGELASSGTSNGKPSLFASAICRLISSGSPSLGQMAVYLEKELSERHDFAQEPILLTKEKNKNERFLFGKQLLQKNRLSRPPENISAQPDKKLFTSAKSIIKIIDNERDQKYSRLKSSTTCFLFPKGKKALIGTKCGSLLEILLDKEITHAKVLKIDTAIYDVDVSILHQLLILGDEKGILYTFNLDDYTPVQRFCPRVSDKKNQSIQKVKCIGNHVYVAKGKSLFKLSIDCNDKTLKIIKRDSFDSTINVLEFCEVRKSLYVGLRSGDIYIRNFLQPSHKLFYRAGDAVKSICISNNASEIIIGTYKKVIMLDESICQKYAVFDIISDSFSVKNKSRDFSVTGIVEIDDKNILLGTSTFGIWLGTKSNLNLSFKPIDGLSELGHRVRRNSMLKTLNLGKEILYTNNKSVQLAEFY
ncbi:MAG: caspase family protein [Methyloligellaceae bacterium]